jgi:hypothetical protein
VPDDLHELVSFDDPDEQRTWVFDATFLLSPWTCIYGSGCKGVLTEDATEMAQGCCSYGAHFVDDDDVANVVAHVVRLSSEQWQHKKKAAKKGFLQASKSNGEVVTTTRVVDDACIFLNRPGFGRGAGCALHVGALDAGERPLDWKPNVCWQLPLRLVEHVDENGHVTSTLREWKRRDWGDGGQEFHWWCTESADAFVGARPVYEELRDEIIEMIGAKAYELLVPQLERRRAKPTPLPHPAVRKR